MSRREDRPKSTEGHQPKILNENPPNSEEESADVKKHNDDMASRADRPAAGVKNEDAQKDKVGKGFWKGELSTAACRQMAFLTAYTNNIGYRPRWS